MTSRISSPSRSLRVGVLGCGYIAGIHLAALARGGPLSVVVADADRSAAERLAAEHGAEVVDPDDLGDQDLDVVLLCTPHDVREEWLIAFARSVPLVVCEKPLALSLAQAEHIRDSLATATTRIAIAFNQRFMPGTVALRAWLAAEREPATRIRIDLTSPPFMHTWAGSTARGGGVLVGLGSHAFDLWRQLTGQDGQQMTTITSHVRGHGSEEPDTAVVVIEGEAGVPSVVTLQDSGSTWWSMEEGRMLDVDIRTTASAARMGPVRLQTWRDDTKEHTDLDLSSGDFLADWGYAPLADAIRTTVEHGGRPRDAGLAEFDDGLAVARMVERARRPMSFPEAAVTHRV